MKKKKVGYFSVNGKVREMKGSFHDFNASSVTVLCQTKQYIVVSFPRTISDFFPSESVWQQNELATCHFIFVFFFTVILLFGHWVCTGLESEV